MLGSTTQGRGGVLVRDGGRTVDVDRFTSHFWLSAGEKTVEVDGVNRVTGRIQNCGGIGGDIPWSVPQHDRACTDDSELVRFTPEWGTTRTTPAGTGAEIVLDARGKAVAINPNRGTTVPAAGSTIQGTGDSAQWLLDKSFTCNWVLRSNPRSMIGMDKKGRLLLAVFDGRQQGYAAGLSIPDTAAIMRRLGATEEINLDGGGSSVMATSAGIVNRPSDAGHVQRRQNDG